MNIENLKSKILYEKELKILSKHLPKDLSNIVFNIATKEWEYFPRFTIFKSNFFTKKYYTDYNYYMYVGSYSGNSRSYVVLMNICISRENKFISSNKIYIIEITSNLYLNNELRFNRYMTRICDILHISKYDLHFNKTNLTFDDFLSKENFVSYILS